MGYDLSSYGKALQDAASAINQKVHDEVTDIPYDEIQKLEEKEQDILIQSKAVYALKTIELSNEGLTALNSLSEASNEIKQAIKTLSNVQSVIEIAATLILLTTAVTTGNISGIVTYADNIVAKVKSINGKDTDSSSTAKNNSEQP